MAGPSNTPNPELVTHVRELVGDDQLTDEQVNRVIVALQAVHAGEPVGTVRMDPATGAVAQRVDIGGVHKWRVIRADGSLVFDTRPALDGWDSVRKVES